MSRCLKFLDGSNELGNKHIILTVRELEPNRSVTGNLLH